MNRLFKPDSVVSVGKNKSTLHFDDEVIFKPVNESHLHPLSNKLIASTSQEARVVGPVS